VVLQTVVEPRLTHSATPDPEALAMIRFLGAMLLAAIALACDGSPLDVPSTVAAPPTPTPSSPPSLPPTSPRPAAVISLAAPLPVLPLDFVGVSRAYWVTALDAVGEPANVHGVLVSSSNEAIARVSRVDILYDMDSQSGRVYSWAWATVLGTGVGTTEITATLGSLTASKSLEVAAVPTAKLELEVDSFTVVEYRPEVYAPFLWLTEPEGTSGEALEAIEVSLGPLSTGWCRSSGTPLASGQTVRINERIDRYVYNNDFILVSLSGPVADTTATARILVRNVAGEFGVLEASAPIRRGEVPFGPPTANPCG
jgi:hypothetical protein